ncbi:hypothetical protein [Thalassolituus sp.]|uniref:hypothetical protein n=1 Tax=Thalassolituus sp. TaxID=2030822 RepID=UPI003518B3A8
MKDRDFEILANSAREAINEMYALSKKVGHYSWMDSIKPQLEFIESHAADKRDPLKMLAPDQEFTYGIVSSKELASPDEMMLKDKLNLVTRNLRELWD